MIRDFTRGGRLFRNILNRDGLISESFSSLLNALREKIFKKFCEIFLPGNQ